MSATVIRLSQYANALDSRSANPSESTLPAPAPESTGDRFDASLPEITPNNISKKAPLHREARKRVFENIVTSTLSNPNHPYSKYPDLKGMISAITEELVNSHYLT